MAKYLLVAADAARARIFSREKKYSALQEIDTLVHPESRLMRQDLVSDRPGQVHESRSPGESSHQEPTDPKQKESDRFAHELAAYLRQACNGNDIAGITLVAEPGFLGQVRKAMDSRVRKLVIREVTKSVTTQTPDVIAATADRA